MKTYGLIKAAIPAELGRRVSKAMSFEVRSDAPAYEEERLARRFCELQGWMFISFRSLPAGVGMTMIAEQENDSDA